MYLLGIFECLLFLNFFLFLFTFCTCSGDNELIELLWQNGHVVMQSQTRKPPAAPSEPRQIANKPESTLKLNNSLAQEDETAPWFPYPIDDSLEKDFFSEFFSEISANACSSSYTPDKPNKDSLMPPPKTSCDGVARLSKQQKTDKGRGGEGSNMTVGSSICGSNTAVKGELQGEKLHASGHDATISCNSSGCSYGRTGQESTGNQSNKRKERDLEESASLHGEVTMN